VESYDFDAWGRLLSVIDGSGNALGSSAIGNRYLFHGREFSWTTGLYYFRARWYDPVTGRWLSPDPIGINKHPTSHPTQNPT
ncbi:MAG: RHS repeat-associated core domain-containing protein, partial [bacterium]